MVQNTERGGFDNDETQQFGAINWSQVDDETGPMPVGRRRRKEAEEPALPAGTRPVSDATEVIKTGGMFGFPTENQADDGGMQPPDDYGFDDYDDEPERRGHGKRNATIAVLAIALSVGGVAYAKGHYDGSGGGYPLLPTATSTAHPGSTKTSTKTPSKTKTPTKTSSSSSSHFISPTSTTSPSSTSKSSETPSTTVTPTSQSASPTTTPETTPAIPVPTKPEQCVNQLPLDWRINQTLTVGLDGSEVDGSFSTVTGLEQSNIGGVVVMTQPAKQNGITALQTLSSKGIFIGTDQEGGTVERINVPGTSVRGGHLPSAQEAANTLSSQQYESLVQQDMAYLKSIGINTVFAPVADVAPEDNQSTEGPTRQYSNDPKVVTKYVQAYIDGAKQAGVNPVMKHFPGMGRASANTDFGAAVTPPLSSLKKIDWKPYKNINDKADQDVMVGTPVVPEWGKMPAALVPQPYDALQNMGYANGVKWTDSLNTRGAGGTSLMSGALKATGLNLPQATSLALQSGATEVMMVGLHGGDENFSGDISAIDTQVASDIKSGKLSETQLNRAVLTDLGAKGINACNVLQNTK